MNGEGGAEDRQGGPASGVKDDEPSCEPTPPPTKKIAARAISTDAVSADPGEGEGQGGDQEDDAGHEA
ncbi:hypothetical protein ACWDBW_31775 [Streptomyces sp. NPDC001107]